MKKILYIILSPDKRASASIPDRSIRLLSDMASRYGGTIVHRFAPLGLSGGSITGLLGIDPVKYPFCSAPIECLAHGLSVNPGDLAVSIRLAHAENCSAGLKISDAEELESREGDLLSDDLNRRIMLPGPFEFKSVHSNKGIMVVRGIRCKFSSSVSCNDPGSGSGETGKKKVKLSNGLRESFPLAASRGDKRALNSASVINSFTRQSYLVLSDLEINRKRIARGKRSVNIALVSAAGDNIPEFPDVSKRYGIKFALLSDSSFARSAADLSGMDVRESSISGGMRYAAGIIRNLDKYGVLCLYFSSSSIKTENGMNKDIEMKFLHRVMERLCMDNCLAAVTFDRTFLPASGGIMISPVLILGGKRLEAKRSRMYAGGIPEHKLLSELVKLSKQAEIS